MNVLIARPPLTLIERATVNIRIAEDPRAQGGKSRFFLARSLPLRIPRGLSFLLIATSTFANHYFGRSRLLAANRPNLLLSFPSRRLSHYYSYRRKSTETLINMFMKRA